MGGKSKQSQRTKNNVRPSSSSRSAELLSSGISLDGGLMSLGGGKPLPPLFPTLAAANLEQGLNPEFQMCIKKLNKKDPITRAKALHELCELVNSGDVEDVVAALPSWAHFYKTLTADTDRKVREMTQVCHGAIVRVCGRRTAPQLKALLPAWLQAQYDDHAPAQAQAHLSLTSTFPDSKLPEVISFCKGEVMMHLLDNLNGNTEAIISKRIENVEERQLVLSRLTTSSLQGLQYFCVHLPAAHDAWLWEQLQALLAAPPYWKLAQAQPQIRAAWYGATGRLIERYRETWGAQYGARTLRVLLEGARDHSGHAAAPLWTCLLQLMHNVPDWHTYLDKKELLVKRIISVLENGGWGDARHLSNMLLPLLAYLPQDILTKDFYEAFFNAVFMGLENKNVMNSKSERQSWITSLAECVRYLSIQPSPFVLEVVSGVQRQWLRGALRAAPDACLRCSAAAMADLVKYWLKLSKQENTEKYDQLIRNFWQNVGSTVLTQIDQSGTDQNEVGKLIEGHILLLQTLKTSFSQEVKKKHSIKFDGDVPAVTEKCAVVKQQCDAALVERYKHYLEDVVHRICAHYLDSAEKKQMSSAIVTPVFTLLVEFDSKQLFVALARQFDVDSVFRLYDKVFRSWLAGDTMRCKTLVDIVFLLMKYMTEEEQDAMFDTFQQFPPVVVERCVCAAVRHPHVLVPAARRWLRGAVVRAQLRALAGRAALHADRDAAALLVACLADVPTGELLVSEESVSEVLKTVSNAISQPNSNTLEVSSALAARLATSLQEHATQQYALLVLHLFRLNVLVPRGDSRLSLDTWCEVRSSWQDGAAALPDHERTSFLQQAAVFLHDQLFQNMENLDITKIENIVSLCPHLFNRCDDAEVPDDVPAMLAFPEQLLGASAPEEGVVQASVLRHLCVTSQLNCLYDDDNDAIATIIRDSAKSDVKELTKTDLLLYVNKHLFRAIYLRTLLLHRFSSDEEEDELCEQRTWCNALLKHDHVQTEFCNVLYTYLVIDVLYEGYAFWPHYDIIVEAHQKLDSLVMDVTLACGGAACAALGARLAARAQAHAHLWARAPRWLLQHADVRAPLVPAGHTLDDILSGNGYFHTLQASTKWSTESDSEAEYKIKYLVMLRSWYTAFGAAGGAELVRDVTAELVRDVTACDPDVIVNAYYKHNHTMLYDRDITDSPWSEVVSNVAVVEFLSAMVESRGWETRAPHWDFTTISLCSLLASVRKSTRSWGSTKVCMLSRSVLRLWAAVRRFCGALPAECARRSPAAHVADLINEWRDIFSPDTTYNLLFTIMHVLDSCGEGEMTNPQIEVVGALIECTKLLDWDVLASAHKHDALSLVRLVRCAVDALQTPTHHAHMHLAYHLLLALAKPLVLADAQKLKLWSENSVEGEEEMPRPEFCLDYFHDAFVHLHEIVDAALSSVVLGEGTCEFVATSDSYNMALGWLLLADVLAALCQLARGDLSHHYIQIYRERGYAEPLVTAALRLLPLGVFAYAEDATGATPAPALYQDLFLTVKDFSVHEPARGGDVSALACRALYRVLCGAGTGGARGWWGAAPARAARLLERVVLAYVAPPAARDQLMHLHQRAHEIEDTEIRIAWSSNEVTCIYNVEERLIELRVWLARAHPLAAPRLAAPHASGPGANTHWVALYLAYQNGTLLNALKMWTRAVSAKVEASPQCYICYCRLHPHTGRLPRVLCNQCKNKFHSTCLRKWFTTSNKSNCPLCRSAF